MIYTLIGLLRIGVLLKPVGQVLDRLGQEQAIMWHKKPKVMVVLELCWKLLNKQWILHNEQ